MQLSKYPTFGEPSLLNWKQYHTNFVHTIISRNIPYVCKSMHFTYFLKYYGTQLFYFLYSAWLELFKWVSQHAQNNAVFSFHFEFF